MRTAFSLCLTTLIVLVSAPAALAQARCMAKGTMAGQSFVLAHCAVAFEEELKSVTVWVNEHPIAPAEAEKFQMSAYPGGEDAQGKARTMMVLAFCPGGGSATSSPGAVKRIELSVNHAKALMAGRQTVIEAPKQFRVQKLTGEVKAGSTSRAGSRSTSRATALTRGSRISTSRCRASPRRRG
jgi:hypothetical protein